LTGFPLIPRFRSCGRNFCPFPVSFRYDADVFGRIRLPKNKRKCECFPQPLLETKWRLDFIAGHWTDVSALNAPLLNVFPKQKPIQ
jgi:hypothetical protein